MIFDILTLLPEVCRAYGKASILGRAQKAGLIELRLTNVRDFAFDRHRTVDDYPYGGGDGMVMKVEPLVAALESLPGKPKPRIILMSPAGRPFDQQLAAELASLERLVLICGRYEGIDERVRKLAVDQEISVGDYVLSGGELPALTVVDAVSRLIPGVLGGEGSAASDSFSDGLLEHPHYTRPDEFRGLKVPEVLLSGNHVAIARWRQKESLRRTWLRRPELLERLELTDQERDLLAEVKAEQGQGQP